MWHALVRHIRRVALVAWVVVLVAFVPSRAWSVVDDSATTSDPAPTSSDSAESSSPEPSPPPGSDTSSSTSDSSDSSVSTADPSGVVVLDAAQFDALYGVLIALGVGLSVVVLLLSAFVVASWGDRS